MDLADDRHKLRTGQITRAVSRYVWEQLGDREIVPSSDSARVKR